MIPALVICVPGLPDRTDYATRHLTERGVQHQVWQGFPGVSMGLATNKAYTTDGHEDKPCPTCKDGQLSFKMNAGCVACTLSHLALYKHIIASGYEEALIFENDVSLPDDFAAKFAAFHANLPAGWDLAYLGWSGGDEKADAAAAKPVAPGVAIVPGGSMQTHAYMVSLKGARFLDEHCQQAWRPIDVSIMVEGAGRLKMYFAHPKIAGQLTASGKMPGSLHFGAESFVAPSKADGGTTIIADGDSWRYEDGK